MDLNQFLETKLLTSEPIQQPILIVNEPILGNPSVPILENINEPTSTVSPKDQNECPICKKTFSTKIQFNRHIMRSHYDVYQLLHSICNVEKWCVYCKNVRETFEFINLQKKTKNSLLKVCGYCAATKKYAKLFDKIFRKRSMSSYCCEKCDFITANKKSFGAHCWTKHKIKTFKCKKCKKSFGCSSSQYKHKCHRN